MPTRILIFIAIFLAGSISGGYIVIRAMDQMLSPLWLSYIASEAKSKSLILKMVKENDNKSAIKYLCNDLKEDWPISHKDFMSSFENGLFPMWSFETSTTIQGQLKAIETSYGEIEKSTKYCTPSKHND